MTVAALVYSASPLSLDVRAYLSIAAMGLVFNPFGRLALSNAPRFAPVADVALFSPIETVAGTIWAAAFFNEFPRPVAAVGAASSWLCALPHVALPAIRPRHLRPSRIGRGEHPS